MDLSKEKGTRIFTEYLRKVGQRHLTLCEESLQRMVKGVELLNNPQTLKAFQLANLAILLQQQNGKNKRSGVMVDNTIQFVKPINKNSNDMLSLSKKSNSWRAFQIAFILASIESFVDEKSETRDIVDLIWFPTGGGKTEAYLGTVAFQMLLRRLRDPKDAGVDVIMRYTLRLLTADQFQRSSRLICSLEYIRKKDDINLGTEPFSIGIWVGSSTTPNSNDRAKKQLNDLLKNQKATSQFIVNNCPWCGAKLGYYKEKNNKRKKHYFGYKIDNNSLILHCPDQECEFYNNLPIYIVDETIYKKRPTFLIGTVDKFVQLVWEPRARFLFGLDETGDRLFNPPSLIVQDELHLISGPLGTLTGLFETLVEELCVKELNGQLIKPKIIAATATIKQFEEQTKALFGRKNARLFPSPGLDSDDSFFARPAIDSETGKLMPGRKYIGVYTTTVRIMMSQVMTFSSILQGASEIKASEKDPYWTLLAFYNTLRELGGGLTLTQMDIAQYSNAMVKRKGNKESLRYINNVLELTSRKQSHEISKAIDDLKLEFDEVKRKQKTENSVIDMCLASNIIEVGVDIERLSVMGIVGQPKMTAQYIQVSGRVGRKWWERPGLIFTLYSNTKSRDKSHFEHFREYHEKLYAQVEATSVTPFSDSSLDKGLEAVIVGFLRQSFDKELSIVPSQENINKNWNKIKTFMLRIVERAKLIDPEQVPELINRLDKISKKLRNKTYSAWEAKDEGNGYMYVAGNMVSPIVRKESVSMINSLRTVDSECRGMITSLYNESHSENDKDELGFLN
ncbi:helicase-related protein [Exiguobacterium sp. SL14]|nr:helicase-related protein [Exiguobacterium sp. SL14]MCY1692421.1 helicase-related protein [Exiguobacterium sp. SL14]